MTAIAYAHGMPIFTAPRGFHHHLPDMTIRLVMKMPTGLETIQARLDQIRIIAETRDQRRTPNGAASQHNEEIEWLAMNVGVGATLYWQPVTLGMDPYPFYVVFHQAKDMAAFMLVFDHQ